MASILEDDEDADGLIGEELETLRAIYMDDIEIQFFEDSPSRPRLLSYVVEPATAHEKANRYVSFTLELVLKENYPFSSPEINVKNPRGLSEGLVRSIYVRLREQAEEGKGNPVLFELMETAKDFITDQKMPTCGCAICLCDFEEKENEADDFMRTDCFHFFHIECLSHYVEYSLAEIAIALEEKQKLNPHAEPDVVGCPVCRVAVNETLLDTLPLHQQNKASVPSTKKSGKKNVDNVSAPRRRLSSGGWNSLPIDIRQKLEKERKEREKIFNRQKAKGAIIDIEAEKSKYKLTLTKEDGYEAEDSAFGPNDESDVPSYPEQVPTRETYNTDDGRRVGARGKPQHRRRKGHDSGQQRIRKNFEEKVVVCAPRDESDASGERTDAYDERINASSERTDASKERIDASSERTNVSNERADGAASERTDAQARHEETLSDANNQLTHKSVDSTPENQRVCDTKPILPLTLVATESDLAEGRLDIEPPLKAPNSRENTPFSEEANERSFSHSSNYDRLGSRGHGYRGRGRGDGGGWRGSRGGRGRGRGYRGGGGGGNNRGGGGNNFGGGGGNYRGGGRNRGGGEHYEN